MMIGVTALTQGVDVALAPGWVRQPVLTLAEAAVMIPLFISVGYYTFVLARAWWPWARRRQASKRESRWWVASFVAFPLLLVAFILVSKAEDRRFDGLRQDRDDTVAALTDQALADLVAEYGVTPVDGSRSAVDSLVYYPKNLHGSTDVRFINAAGVEVDCALAVTPRDNARELTLDCPSTDATEET